MTKAKKGFTLIEMTIVLFIISLLILIVVPNLSQQKKNAQGIHGNAMTHVVQMQIDGYLNDNANDTVSYEKLIRSGYLSDKQSKQAQSEGIKIVNNHAQK